MDANGMSHQPEQERDASGGLATLLQIHRAELLRFLTARCGAADEAEDVLQDMWFRVTAQSSGPITNGRAYLFRVANNLVLDRSRARHRAMRRERLWLEAEDGGATPLPEERADPAELPEEKLVREQEEQALRGAIAALPDGARRALRLYRFEGLGHKEIAETLRISRSGVEKHLALAMKKLREALSDCGVFDAAASVGPGEQRGGKPHMERGQ